MTKSGTGLHDDALRGHQPPPTGDAGGDPGSLLSQSRTWRFGQPIKGLALPGPKAGSAWLICRRPPPMSRMVPTRTSRKEPWALPGNPGG